MSTERYKHIEIQAPQEFPYQRETIVAYQAAFAGYPWFENLSVEEVLKRFNKYLSTPGFEGIWLIDQANGKPVAATWWTMPDLDTLEKERGSKLRTFIDSNFKISGENTIVIGPRKRLFRLNTKDKVLLLVQKTLLIDIWNKRQTVIISRY